MTAWAYYNEFDPHAAQWLRNLIDLGAIAPGIVDERDIRDVQPDDLRGFAQCHFFAGIGVWSYALRRAGWPDSRPVWTGSCPCQGFSASGQRRGFEDERHLWPEWYRLIRARRPSVVFGEQVQSSLVVGKARDKESEFGPYGLYEPDRETQIPTAWFDLVCADMEATGYAMGVSDSPAAGSGAPHIRQRLYFVAHRLEYAEGYGWLERRPEPSQWSAVGRRGAEWLEHSDGGRAGAQSAMHRAHDEEALRGTRTDDSPSLSHGTGSVDRLVDGQCQGLEGLAGDGGRGGGRPSPPRSIAASGVSGGMADGDGRQSGEAGAVQYGGEHGQFPADGGAADGMADAGRGQFPQQIGRPQGRDGDGSDRSHPERSAWRPGPVNGFWRDVDWLFCRDGKWRPVEAGSFPLVDGTAFRVGSGSPFEGKSRQEMLRGYGNAIVSEAAVGFIEDYLEATGCVIDAHGEFFAGT